MIPVKIECPCGQHYAFEVEPVMGRMPAPVACPACGHDGTIMANEKILELSQPSALSEAPPQAVPTASSRPMIARAPATSAASRPLPSIPGQPGKTQLLFEAR